MAAPSFASACAAGSAPADAAVSRAATGASGGTVSPPAARRVVFDAVLTQIFDDLGLTDETRAVLAANECHTHSFLARFSEAELACIEGLTFGARRRIWEDAIPRIRAQLPPGAATAAAIATAAQPAPAAPPASAASLLVPSSGLSLVAPASAPASVAVLTTSGSPAAAAAPRRVIPPPPPFPPVSKETVAKAQKLFAHYLSRPPSAEKAPEDGATITRDLKWCVWCIQLADILIAWYGPEGPGKNEKVKYKRDLTWAFDTIDKLTPPKDMSAPRDPSWAVGEIDMADAMNDFYGKRKLANFDWALGTIPKLPSPLPGRARDASFAVDCCKQAEAIFEFYSARSEPPLPGGRQRDFEWGLEMIGKSVKLWSALRKKYDVNGTTPVQDIMAKYGIVPFSEMAGSATATAPVFESAALGAAPMGGAGASGGASYTYHRGGLL